MMKTHLEGTCSLLPALHNINFPEQRLKKKMDTFEKSKRRLKKVVGIVFYVFIKIT